MNVYEDLLKESEYAIRSRSRDLVFESYGKAKMAVRLKAITMQQFKELNRILIRDGVNNHREIKLS